jgi:hypothetical protein
MFRISISGLTQFWLERSSISYRQAKIRCSFPSIARCVNRAFIIIPSVIAYRFQCPTLAMKAKKTNITVVVSFTAATNYIPLTYLGFIWSPTTKTVIGNFSDFTREFLPLKFERNSVVVILC